MNRLLRLSAVLLVALWCATGSAFAVQPDERLADPALEARARLISQELRCLVCQNQSIDDSDAELAKDLRVLVRERLTAGDSNDQVLDFIVARYGEFALLKPRIEQRTIILWFAAPALLVLGLAGSFMVMRRRKAVAEVPLTDEEKAALKTLTD